MIRIHVKNRDSGQSSVVCVPYLVYEPSDGTLWWEEDYPWGVQVYEMPMSAVLAELLICRALTEGYVDLVPHGFAVEVSGDD